MNMTEPPSVTKSMINHITILLISFLQMEEWKQSETTYNLRVECCVRKFPVAIQYLVVDTWTSFIKFIYMISFSHKFYDFLYHSQMFVNIFSV